MHEKLSRAEVRAASPVDSFRFRETPLIAFLGSGLDFPAATLELLRREIEGIEIARFEGLRELRAAVAAGDLRVHLLVLSEGRAADILQRPEAYREVVGAGRIALAYRHAEVARRLRAARLAVEVGFIPMHCEADAWTSYVRLLCFGENVIPAELEGGTQAAAGPAPQQAPEGKAAGRALIEEARLTRREAQILALVAEGLRNREIGTRLHVSEHTVKLHLHNIFVKLGVSNRAGAAARFLQGRAHDTA